MKKSFEWGVTPSGGHLVLKSRRKCCKVPEEQDSLGFKRNHNSLCSNPRSGTSSFLSHMPQENHKLQVNSLTSRVEMTVVIYKVYIEVKCIDTF